MTKHIKTRDLYKETTNRIIAMLEKGVAPWRCTWNKYGFAKNYATGHIYTGINTLFMNNTEHPIPYFMSFKQAQEKGGKIRKGAKSEIVLYYNVFFKDADNNTLKKEEATARKRAGDEVNTLSFLKYFNVFNIDDIEGIDFEIPEVELKDNEKLEKCESIINNMADKPELKFIDANRAYYSPADDVLNMPDIRQFGNSEEYYTTYFHELVHSTGHGKRLCRDGVTKLDKFGSKQYSEEELIGRNGRIFLICSRRNQL